MEGLTAFGLGARLPRRIRTNLNKNCPFYSHRPKPFLIFAAQDNPKLNKWDQMELKFGKLLGENPKLTLAKIMARKENPRVSYLDVEKSFMKSKDELDDTMLNMPAEVFVEEELSPPQTQKPQDLPRQSKLNLSRPVMNKATRSKMLEEKSVYVEAQKKQLPRDVNKNTTNNISLRKPSVFYNEDHEADSSKFEIMPNLYFKTRTSPTQSFSKVTLLKKPEMIPLKPFGENITCDSSIDINSTCLEAKDNVDRLDKVEPENVFQQNIFERIANYDITAAMDNESEGTSYGLQPPMQKGVQQIDTKFSSTSLYENSISNKNDVSVKASLLEKPNRQEFSDSESLHPVGLEATSSNEKAYNYSADVMQFQSTEEGDREYHDWIRAENRLKLGERAEVELISCSSRGFVASFGSLIGFLPYRYVGTKWKFLAFESWLRKKGLDPSLHRNSLGIVGNCDGQSKKLELDSNQNFKKDKEVSLSDMKFEELFEAYEQEKIKYLSSFVGQRLKVSVVLADRSSRRLMFSEKPKENEELVKKKKILMARLTVGDIIKCCIKKITYFGIFVEVEGVPALIHQSEVSWDTTLEPSTYFKIGQIVEAKVHQLDFALERITLSLKEVVSDPLMGNLESVISGQTSMGENLESALADIEWADVDSLIKDLQRVDGIINVTKGRFFLSPGLTPAFQVYMASMFDNQYKLLARFENKVQEILVQTSLDKEQLKDAILACTNGAQ